MHINIPWVGLPIFGLKLLPLGWGYHSLGWVTTILVGLLHSGLGYHTLGWVIYTLDQIDAFQNRLTLYRLG
ncbi:1864_t:CDS:2 [Dentiscutata heterogama]|uniref:1864_t:CDS:1 n=1 Tax=Dentiscutata heterogama TaxID=1316150 RepID=A0ACA9KLH0_9GLOM|nr:1864_t:CDS:2 [Dentiscutata heterogama]